MGWVILPNQSAFLKGRNIADNMFLVREILHLFGSPKYKEKSFMLKADNGKAFDTLGWQFIFGAMKEINIPNGIARLIQFCMSSSRVTILVNGSGSGFIKPTRGLRQGNPLSPYLFIIAIEFLTKRINVAIQRGMLKGIKLAKQAPVLSHALYADDLVILGQASGTEVMDLEAIFDAFAQASGLQINPEKSSMWFSSDCTEDEKGAIMQQLGAKLAEDNEQYLGVFISTQLFTKRSHA